MLLWGAFQKNSSFWTGPALLAWDTGSLILTHSLWNWWALACPCECERSKEGCMWGFRSQLMWQCPNRANHPHLAWFKAMGTCPTKPHVQWRIWSRCVPSTPTHRLILQRSMGKGDNLQDSYAPTRCFTLPSNITKVSIRLGWDTPTSHQRQNTGCIWPGTSSPNIETFEICKYHISLLDILQSCSATLVVIYLPMITMSNFLQPNMTGSCIWLKGSYLPNWNARNNYDEANFHSSFSRVLSGGKKKDFSSL